MKLIIYPDVDIWTFVLSGLSGRSDVLLFPLNRYGNIFQKVVRKYGNDFPVPVNFVLNADLRHAIQGLKAGDAIVIAEYTDPALLTAVAKIVPSGVSRFVWLWNHKGNKTSFTSELLSIKKNRFQVITYDELDAIDYGFVWHTQFFNIKPYQKAALRNYPISHDFLFVGYAKNREEEIQSIQSLLSSYSTNFVTVHGSSDYIPYIKYMEMALESRCIVEIVHTGDPSCTLRPLEAMTIHRKLVTNNPSVRKYSFYRSQNIFILGEDDISKLPDFLHSPYELLPSDIVDSYDVNSWIELFQ